MRWVTYRAPGSGTDRPGLLHDGLIHGVPDVARLVDLLGDDGTRLREAGELALRRPVDVVPLAEAVLSAPIPRPGSIRDFMAFEAHVVSSNRAMGGEIDPGWYDAPVFYFTNPAAVRGPHDDVPVSPGSSRFDYELEIGAVIGRAGSDLDPAEAEAHIAGYLILSDWSARDLQMVEMRQGLGPAKGKDTATSFGPFLVTPDELEHRRSGKAFDLAMTAHVNGRQYSAGTMADLHWSFGQMLAYASRGTQLLPGDVIGSGTVGTGCILELSRVHGEASYPWLEPGDEVRIDVDELGTILTTIVPGREVIPL